jgi:hypothetical protein
MLVVVLLSLLRPALASLLMAPLASPPLATRDQFTHTHAHAHAPGTPLHQHAHAHARDVRWGHAPAAPRRAPASHHPTLPVDAVQDRPLGESVLQPLADLLIVGDHRLPALFLTVPVCRSWQGPPPTPPPRSCS